MIKDKQVSDQESRQLKIGTVNKKKKLKLKNLIDQSQTEQFQFINQKVREKLGQRQSFNQSKQLQKQKQQTNKKYQKKIQQQNQYGQIYQNDIKYFQEYLDSTAKYENSGVNLKWPYYFTKNNEL